MSFWQETEDWHTAGEPFRIVRSPPSFLDNGLSVADQRLHIIQTPHHPLDLLRQSLCKEPRGHSDMYGGFILPGDDTRAHFGVLFWHKDGFSTACGHGTIALGRWAVATGIVELSDNATTDVVIDVPSGRVVAQLTSKEGYILHVDFLNVSGFQFAKQLPLDVDTTYGRFQLKVDLSFAGAVYASVNAKELGLDITPDYIQQFIDLQRIIKVQLGNAAHYGPYELYGVCFFEELSDSDVTVVQKNVVVFADGQIDRSPCGSGTSARLAVLLAQGSISQSKKLVHKSIVNTTFEAFVKCVTPSPTAFPACETLIRGNAFLTGQHKFYIDLDDPIYPGFLLR